MCGRYHIETDVIHETIEEYNPSMSFKDLKEGEIFPGDNTLVIALNKNKEPSLYQMSWGYRFDGKLIFNSRSEGIENKYLFKEDFKKHRCVIPCSYYFEWNSNKEKNVIKNNENIMYLAGIFRIENNHLEFSILTKDADNSLKELHDRMPVLLKKDEIKDYLNLEGNPKEYILDDKFNLTYEII